MSPLSPIHVSSPNDPGPRDDDVSVVQVEEEVTEKEAENHDENEPMRTNFRLIPNPAPAKRYIRDSRLNPTIVLDRAIPGTSNPQPEPASTPPNANQANAPDTPIKNKKSPVVIAIKKKEVKKKKPSPIKFPKDSDQEEQPDREDVPLSRLLPRSTPRQGGLRDMI